MVENIRHKYANTHSNAAYLRQIGGNIDPIIKAWVSNYVTFSNNPIIYIDPKGNTDYYNTNSEWIGTDGISNGKKQIVLGNATALLISIATKNNTTISINRNIYDDVLDLFTDEFMTKLDAGYTNSEKTNNESAVAQGGSGTVYTTTSTSGSSVNIIPELIKAGETTITQDAHFHPPIVIPYYKKGNLINLGYAGMDVPSSIESTKEKTSGDMERAAELKLHNPCMVLGYSGLPEHMNKVFAAKTLEEIVSLLGDVLNKKINNPANSGINLRIPLGSSSPFTGVKRHITFYNGSNPKIYSTSYSNFKLLINNVKKSEPKTINCPEE